jgi:hypothetical protein
MNKLPVYYHSDVESKSNKELLELAIKKWQTIVKENERGISEENYGATTCALCAKYLDNNPHGPCVGCSIFEDTGRPSCLGTPFTDFHHAVQTPEKSQSELDYLQELYDRLYPEPKPEPVSFPRITEDLSCEKTLENENYKVYVHDTFVVVEGKKPDKPKEVFIYTSGAVDIKDETNYKRVCERGKLLIPEPKPRTKYQQMPFISFRGDEILLVNGKEEAGSKGHDHLYVIKNGEVIASVHISTSSELPRFDVYRSGYEDKPIEELLATKDDC